MTRRRARAALTTELPILASRVDDFQEKVQGAFGLLSGTDPGALGRLATIARDYHDGRRMTAQRVNRPDCRASLEALAELTGRTCEAINRLPFDFREQLGRSARGDLHNCRSPVFPSDVGRALQELPHAQPRSQASDTPAEPEQVFGWFNRLVSELGDRCANLPMDTEWSLIVLQEDAHLLPDFSNDAEYLYRLCDTLGRHAKVAAELMKMDRGPSSDSVQMRAVLALKDEFERIGQKATHNANDSTGYSGKATSPFDHFIHQFFAGVDPDDRQRRGVNDAIAFACWESRPVDRRRKGQGQATRRQGQLAVLLKKFAVTNSSPDPRQA